MQSKKIKLKNGEATAYCVPCGPFNIIFAATGKGMIACGAFDVIALEKFGFPAVRMKKDGGIKTIDGLLDAEAVLINEPAREKGIAEGLHGRDVLERFV